MTETDSATTQTTAPVLPATLRLGPVHLIVTDLDRSVAFYQDAIGLRVHRREDAIAALGAGAEDLLVLVREPQARRAGRHAGLYHVALLHPSRIELARAALRLVATGTPISGASDHGISEAIYLPDPDGNGLELAADRPRAEWPDLGNLAAGPLPLDVQRLLGLVAGEERCHHADPELSVGHVHLHVGSIQEGLGFYRDVIGFEVMTLMPSAAFVAAGGYHHHLGFNTWRGEGVPRAPADTVGLRHWTVELDAPAVAALRARAAAAGLAFEELDEGMLLRDPWGTAVLVRGLP
ncbi:MAG TPA: VOC family protein [Solirubrobacteraceae bacterium]|nr:VOC family protein [Solirubrobacteraceae bacterium]